MGGALHDGNTWRTMGMRPRDRESLTVSKTMYADDVQETSVTEAVAELNAVLQVSSQFFDHELECRGLGRNGCKEEHLMNF